MTVMSVGADRTEAGDLHHGVLKSRIAGALLAFITLGAFALANVPYQYVESEVDWVGYLEIADGGGYRAYQDLPVMAGWPLRYWIRYEKGDAPNDRLWLPSRLFVNSALGLLAAGGIYLFVQLRRRKLAEAAESRRAQLILDSCVAFAILAVPGSIFLQQNLVSRYHRQIASDLNRVGSSCLSCWLPAVYSDHLPSGLKRHFVRLRQVHAYGIGQQAADVITSLPTLAAFNCYAGEFDATPLKQLREHPHFCVLQLNRYDLTDAHVDAIGQLPWLNQLRIARTNLDAAQLRRLDHLRLKVVDLSFTDVELEQIGKPDWSETVENLSVSRPADGIEASLTIEGWPNLKSLQVERQSAIMNDTVLSIRLVDLPRLETLHIDRVQKHDLVLRNVPRLERIDEGIADLRYIVNSDMLIPGLTWVRSVEIDGTLSLSSFGCYAKDLEHFSIKHAPSLHKLSIGSFLTTLLGEITPQPVDRELCHEWIEQLGTMDGPAELDLSYLPLSGETLTPLVGNHRVRCLRLNGTGVTYPQVQQLAGMQWLESLVIPTTPLKQDDLAWVLDQFPNLSDLWVDVMDLSHFDLRGRDRLRQVRITPMGSLQEIRVVDLPQLRTSIRIVSPPQTMEICNVPSLRGLAVEGPWPATAKLKGLRDLEWFTGGGAGVNDEVVNEVLKCDTLDRLTLAYPSVSAETLRRIGNLKELTFLALPGAKVNDEVVRDWHNLSSLWEVNLDDTEISAETIAWLSRMESLRRLSINRVPLSKAAAEAVTELSQVSELYLAGVSMSYANLRAVLKHGNLETLDLSGWKVDEELVNIICTDGANLRHLILRDTDMSASAFKQLLAVSSKMFIELGSVPEFVDASSLDELHRRAGVLRRDMNTGWRLMLKPNDDVYGEYSPRLDDADAKKGLGVPSLPISYMSQLSRQRFTSEHPASN